MQYFKESNESTTRFQVLTHRDLWEIGHNIPDGYGPVRSGLGPLAVRLVALFFDLNAKRSLGKRVHGLGVQGQGEPRGGGNKDTPAPCLGDSKVARLQNAKRALISHLHQSSQGQFQYHAFLEIGKVFHVFE